MTRRRKDKESELSVKSLRVLEAWGIERAMANGAVVVPVGPAYCLSDGRAASLAFTRDEEGRMCVGYATREGEEWKVIDLRPYSARTLGYFRRRLRRVGRREDELDDHGDAD
jgi:hypothetical protein